MADHPTLLLATIRHVGEPAGSSAAHVAERFREESAIIRVNEYVWIWTPCVDVVAQVKGVQKALARVERQTSREVKNLNLNLNAWTRR